MSKDQQANPIVVKTGATRGQRLLGLTIFLVIGGGLALLNLLQRVGFDFGLLFWPCGFRVRTGYPCITCGMTRSVLAFSRGDLVEAFRLQPAAGFIGLLIVAVGAMGLVVGISGRIPGFVRRFCTEFRLRRCLLLLALILLAGWVVTLAQAYRVLH